MCNEPIDDNMLWGEDEPLSPQAGPGGPRNFFDECQAVRRKISNFGDFEKAAMNDLLERIRKPTPSIYQET